MHIHSDEHKDRLSFPRMNPGAPRWQTWWQDSVLLCCLVTA